MKYPVFVETGTYMGETIFAMEPFFEKLYTIELSEKYHSETKAKYSGNKITFLKGDSSEKIKELCPMIEKDAIFFLDGHFSGGDTAQGAKDCPLLEEVEHIVKLCKKRAIIIIDDCRLFAKGIKDGFNEDWTEITKEAVIRLVRERLTNCYFLDSASSKNDRMILHIEAIN